LLLKNGIIKVFSTIFKLFIVISLIIYYLYSHFLVIYYCFFLINLLTFKFVFRVQQS